LTDREKIIEILDILCVPYYVKASQLYFSGRRLTFNGVGELVRLQDYIPKTARRGK
jgi:hypothetical protein